MSTTGLLRAAVEQGATDSLAADYLEGARLDASLRGARHVASGPGEITPLISEWWSEPATLAEFTVAEFDDGVAVWLERVDGDGRPERQRHYIRRDGRASAGTGSTPPRRARPRTGPREPTSRRQVRSSSRTWETWPPCGR